MGRAWVNECDVRWGRMLISEKSLGVVKGVALDGVGEER